MSIGSCECSWRHALTLVYLVTLQRKKDSQVYGSFFTEVDAEERCSSGIRFDCGNKAGLVRATMHMAMQDPKLAPTVRAFLEQL